MVTAVDPSLLVESRASPPGGTGRMTHPAVTALDMTDGPMIG